jgi:Tfp pilus assembly protein FimV
VSRHRLVRLAAPAAFLLAVTIAVLLVRAGLHGDDDEQTQPVTLARTTRAQLTTATGRPRLTQRTYTVREGDTLDQIALDFDTTVERLLELNPDIEPTALRPGQRLRVP